MIICAAVKYKDQIIRCHRHWHGYAIIKQFLDPNRRPEYWNKSPDWFVDSCGDFLDREQAFVDAYMNDQISDERYHKGDKELYSEDLY